MNPQQDPVASPLRKVALLATLCVLQVSFLKAQSPEAPLGNVPDELAEELRVQTTDGLSLAGSLYLPEGSGPYPAVVIVHGSEPGSRTDPGYIRWARVIREQGLACLIFDKRGVKDSEGEYVEAPDLQAPASDVLAWVGLLKSRPDVRKDAIGVLGWSQGGWIGPLAASKDPDIAFVVAISGPGVSPLEQNIFDKSSQFETAGLSPMQVEWAGQTVRLIMSYMVTGEGYEEAQAAWNAVRDEAWFGDNYRGIPLIDRDTLLSDPRGQMFVAHNIYDPIPALEALRVPMLAVFGASDRIVPVQLSIDRMMSAFERSGNSDLTVKVFPAADHGIRVRGPDGAPRLAEGYPDVVLDWLQATAMD